MRHKQREIGWHEISRVFLVSTIAMMIVLAPSKASAYELFPWWWSTEPTGEAPITFRFGSNLQNPGSAWRVAFEQARDDWNTRPIRPYWHHYQDTGTVWLNTYYEQGGAFGYMEWPQPWYWNQQTNQITACYLFGNTARSNSGNRPDLQRRSTAGHEMGHCMGLDHSNVWDSLMRTGRDREVYFSPWQDDVNGINHKYP
jgi:hypothetical protein